MQAIRKRLRPENGHLNIRIPDNLRGKELEIIILPVEDDFENEKPIDPVQYRGALKINLTNDEIDNDIKRGREEWQKRIY